MAQNNTTDRNNREVTHEVIRHFGIMSTSPRGWTKELNLVKWNEGRAKYDLRDWDAEHKKMSKGITFTEEEAYNLREVLNSIPLELPEELNESSENSTDNSIFSGGSDESSFSSDIAAS